MALLLYGPALLLCAQSSVAATANGLPLSQTKAPTVLAAVNVSPADRIYVMDSAFMHIADSRINVFDKRDGRFLGFVSTGFNGQMLLSMDGRTIYDVTTYFSRLTRGERTDVVEAYDAHTLRFLREIPIPAKRASVLNYKGVLRLSGNGQFLLEQNATPAVSVTVVDLRAKKFVNDVTATAGCWDIIPLPGTARSFATICGDGSLLWIELGDDGKVVAQRRSRPMFSVADDPIFACAAFENDTLMFVSFNGNVYSARLDRANRTFRFGPAWPLVQDAFDRAAGWVPGGANLIAADGATHRLYVLMHPHGKEGSQGYPAKEIWVFDTDTHRRVARVPANGAISIAPDRANPQSPQLLAIDGNNVQIFDIAKAVPELVRTIKGAAEASVQVQAGIPLATE
jgi:amicyanin-dependent methylamine dehydrogenase large subunit